MRIILTIRRGRKGTASLFGTLIFIGILFSAVIPMYLVMNQADTIFEQRKHEVATLDEEKTREDVIVYVYPTTCTEDNLTVLVHNACELDVKIIRVWINDTYHMESVLIETMSEEVVGSYDVDPKEGSVFDINVATERGNVFECSSGEITHDGMNWDVENLMINVLVSSSGVVFKIYVDIWDDQAIPPEWDQIGYAQVWKIGGSAFKSFDLTYPVNYPVPSTYRVTVKKGSSTIHEEQVIMDWPEGPSVIWIYS